MKKLFIFALIAVSLVLFTHTHSEANPYAPNFSGVAYIQGHGGHIAIVDLATGKVGRIVHGKPSDALTLSKDGKTIYVFSLDGHAKEIYLDKGTQTDWVKLGNKHCGSAIAPDGNIWVSDMKDGNVYIYDPKKKKLADTFNVSKSICAITFSKDGSKAYIADMPGAFVSVVDVKSKKVIAKVDKVGNYVHRGRVTPDGKEVWISDGNEIKDGKAYGAGYVTDGESHAGGVSIIDTASGKVADYVVIGGNPHDVEFSKDGKYAFVASRQIPDTYDSAIAVVEAKSRKMVKMYSACKRCHAGMGFEDGEVPGGEDAGKAFLCGIDINWTQKAIPESPLIDMVH